MSHGIIHSGVRTEVVCTDAKHDARPLSPSAAWCRAALHLQLTTELVTAAAGAGSEAGAESIWQQAGAAAMQDAVSWASRLLQSLTECDLSSASGMLSSRAE